MKSLNGAVTLLKTSVLFVGTKAKDLLFYASDNFSGVIVAFVAIGALSFGVLEGAETFKAWMEAERAKERAEGVTLAINDSTVGKWTKLRADKDSLQASLQAAEELNGELIAALRIATKPDTVFVVDTVWATTFEEVAGVGIRRTATLVDTTDMGIELTFNAEAPANPRSPLVLGYQVMVPSFTPEIGFVRTDEGVVATVTWANQDFTVEAPFFKEENNFDRLSLSAGALVGVLANAGTTVPIYSNAYLALDVQTSESWKLRMPVGISNSGLYAGIGFEKKLFGVSSFRDLLPF